MSVVARAGQRDRAVPWLYDGRAVGAFEKGQDMIREVLEAYPECALGLNGESLDLGLLLLLAAGMMGMANEDFLPSMKRLQTPKPVTPKMLGIRGIREAVAWR